MEYGNHEQLHHGGNINNNSFISLLQPLVLSAFSLSLLLLLISLSWKTAKYLRFCLYKLLITNVLALCVASCHQWRNLRLYCYHTSQPFVCMCVCVCFPYSCTHFCVHRPLSVAPVWAGKRAFTSVSQTLKLWVIIFVTLCLTTVIQIIPR